VISKIKIKKSILDGFRKRARNTDLEIQGYLIGSIKAIDTIVIDSIEYPTEYCRQTSSRVVWYAEEVELVKKKAEQLDRVVIADLHSHPQWDAVMSRIDYEGCVKENFPICGICSVYGNKTRVRFWNMTSPLPCEIIYI